MKTKPDGRQLSLLDPTEARAVTEDAIDRAEFLTSEDRKLELLNAVWMVAKIREFFRADHVWDQLGEVGDGDRDNGSGLGPVMREAQRLDWIESTGRFERSERSPMHGKPQRVWKSKLYDPNFVPPSPA
jgi:hypothetical protein